MATALDLTPTQMQMVTALRALPDLVAVPTTPRSVTLVDAGDGTAVGVVTHDPTLLASNLPHFFTIDDDLVPEPGPCFTIPPAVVDLVATWRGWDPDPRQHPCPTAAGLLGAVEIVAGVEPDAHTSIRMAADGMATGSVTITPMGTTTGTSLCSWSVDLRVSHPDQAISITDTGIEHVPATAEVTGHDLTGWAMRRAVLRVAQRICQQTPAACPEPRWRAAPSRVTCVEEDASGGDQTET